jgi:hypothetical protein
LDPGWLHHPVEGRTGPVPSGTGPSAFPDRDGRVGQLIEALLAVTQLYFAALPLAFATRPLPIERAPAAIAICSR